MVACFQCGANMALATSVCQRCGYKIPASADASAKNTIASPMARPINPPPRATPKQKVSTASTETIINKSNSANLIIVAVVVLLLVILGGLYFSNIPPFDFVNRTGVEHSVSTITNFEKQKIKSEPALKIKSEEAAPVASPVEVKSSEGIPPNKEIHPFPVESYLNAAISREWSRIDALIASANVLVANRGNRKAARSLNDQAVMEIKNNNYTRAVQLLTRAVSTDESDMEILNNLGFAQLKAGDIASAKKNYFQTLTYAPTRAITWGNLAEVYAEEGMMEFAAASLRIEVYLSKDRKKVINVFRNIALSENPKIRNSKISKLISAQLAYLSEVPERK